MTKPLADMTPEESSECVGMWCKSPAVRADVRMILLTDSGMVFFPTALKTGRLDPGIITPCHDLPRAWTPDGHPVPGEWEDGHVFVSYDEPDPWIVKDTVSIEGLSEGGMSYYQEPPNGIAVELDRFGEGEGKARRWVGEWEPAND